MSAQTEHSRLSAQSVEACAAALIRPGFDRDTLGIGQVHLGVGAFFKAHLATYTQKAIENVGGDWGVCGVSLRKPEVRDALAPQDNLFTVTEKSENGARTTLIGVLKEMLVAPENPRAVIDTLADPKVKLVTLTVTEKGYCLSSSPGGLDVDHPDIAHDLKNLAAPRSAIGFLAAALSKRIEIDAPLTVVSCDNLSDNGAKLKRAVSDFMTIVYPEAAPLIGTIACFPNTMVDRITPASTKDDLLEVSQSIGAADSAAAITEPFTQWVIEDNFIDERPSWETAGALIVRDVTPYELAKLRLLNGPHSAIAYMGQLTGLEYVADVMNDPGLAGFIDALQREEIAPTLAPLSGFSYTRYIEELQARFRNPALRHRTWQIAMDGSQKLPQRLLNTIRDRLARGGSVDRLTLAVAAWTEFLKGADEHGKSIEISDPLAEELKRLSLNAGGEPLARARAFLAFTPVFGDLREAPEFETALANAIGDIARKGVLGAIAGLSQRH